MIAALLGKDMKKMLPLAAAFFGFSALICFYLFQEDYIRDSSYGSGAALIMSGMMLYMLLFGAVMNVEKYEEKNNGYRLLRVLPVSGSFVAGAKFLLVLVSGVVGVLYLELLLRLFDVLAQNPGLKTKYLVLSASAGLLVNGLLYMGVFKYGYHRIRAVIMVVYLVMLIGPQLTHFLLQISGNEYGFALYIDRLSAAAVAIFAVLSVAVYCACFVRSAGLLSEREL